MGAIYGHESVLEPEVQQLITYLCTASCPSVTLHNDKSRIYIISYITSLQLFIFCKEIIQIIMDGVFPGKFSSVLTE